MAPSTFPGHFVAGLLVRLGTHPSLPLGGLDPSKVPGAQGPGGTVGISDAARTTSIADVVMRGWVNDQKKMKDALNNAAAKGGGKRARSSAGKRMSVGVRAAPKTAEVEDDLVDYIRFAL